MIASLGWQRRRIDARHRPTWASRHLLRLIFVCASLSAQASLTDGNAVQPPPAAQAITAIIAAQQHPLLTPAHFANRANDLAALYALADHQLLWLDNAATTKNIEQFFALLQQAKVNGLEPNNYDAAALQQKLIWALNLAPDAYQDKAQYDTALSLSLLRFLHDLHYGRVNPQTINYNLKLREKKQVDLPTLIKAALTQQTIEQLPAQVEPKLRQYQQLKSALADYRRIAEQAPPLHWPFKKPIKPGENIAQIDELRRYLKASGDLIEENDEPRKSNRYSEKLVAAMKKFQYRHGLAADGVIGKSTVAELNTPLEQRIRQIELAMERLRWLPELSADPSIVVNIPAFQLWAYDNVNAANPNVTRMKVVVGKAMKNQTPVLMAEMRFIDFMPYWNVPYNIVKEEILPKLAQNPGFLERENMELVSSTGVTGFSGATIAQLKQGTVRIRQRPGKKNALGKVKFLFPNKNDVYMHDTPANALFSRSRRDFSHGCVRVDEPVTLAEFALKTQGGWDKKTIQKAMSADKMQRVVLKKPIPVMFFYVTAFFDTDNRLVFYPDIYGHDAVLQEALKKTEDVADDTLFAAPRIEPEEKPKTEEIKTVEVVK